MKIKKKIYKLLRWSEKYTQTDMVYLAKGGFWLSLGQIITSGATFLLTLAFANLVPKQTLGTYRYVLSLAGILAIPTLYGMNTALLQAVARGKEGVFVPILKTKLRWGIWGSAASMAVAGYYFFKGNTTLTLCFLITAAFLPLLESFQIYGSFWAGRKRFDVQNKYCIITQVGAVSLLITTLVLTKNIFLIVLVYFVSWSALHFIFLWLTIKKAHFNQEQDPKAISFGKHLSLMGIIGQVDTQLDKILLWHFLGASEVAIYYIVLILPLKIKDLLGVIGDLAFPKISQRSPKELKKTVPKKTLLLFLLVIPIFLLYILFAPYIYKILFPQYANFVRYSQVYALILLTFPRLLFGTSLTAQMRTKELYTCTFVLPPIYIILLLLLVPAYGIWGAISTFLILEVISFILLIFLFKRM